MLEFAGEDAEAVVRWQKLGLLARKSQEPYVRLNEGDAPTKPSRELAFPGDALHNTRSLNQEVMELGIEKTIKLLQRAGKRDLLLKHCRWIVEVNPKDSMRVFDNPRETYDLTYDDVSSLSHSDTPEAGGGRLQQRGEAESAHPIFREAGLLRRHCVLGDS